MNARMEKYTSDNSIKKRTQKNENLYSEVSNMNIDYVDIDVDNAMELNPSGSRTSREDFQKQRELNKILPSHREEHNYKENVVEPKEDRVYDINEILKMAREDKLFEDSEKKRLINTEYNILTKLDVASLESDEMKKEDLRSLIDDIYEKEAPKKDEKIKKYSRSEEAKLLSDLFEEDPTMEKVELEEGLSKAILSNGEEETEEKQESEKEEEEEVVATQILPKDDTMTSTTTMYDFGLEKKKKKDKKKKKEKLEQEVEDDFEEEKEGKFLVVAIIIVVLLILATVGFFLYEYFFGI